MARKPNINWGTVRWNMVREQEQDPFKGMIFVSATAEIEMPTKPGTFAPYNITFFTDPKKHLAVHKAEGQILETGRFQHPLGRAMHPEAIALRDRLIKDGKLRKAT